MQVDGYFFSDDTRMTDFKKLSNEQLKLNGRMKEIAEEISKLPKPPASIGNWIESWNSLDRKDFGLDTIIKQNRIKKEYNKILEQSDSNMRQMKILAIDDLLDKINSITSRD